MTRPDPARTADALAYLMDAVDALRRERDERRVDASEASRLLGYKDQRYLARYPWRVPDFGARGTLLPLADWKAWNEDGPDSLRRAAWDKISLKERRRLLGKAN
jgi:hypothetical protein